MLSSNQASCSRFNVTITDGCCSRQINTLAWPEALIQPKIEAKGAWNVLVLGFSLAKRRRDEPDQRMGSLLGVLKSRPRPLSSALMGCRHCEITNYLGCLGLILKRFFKKGEFLFFFKKRHKFFMRKKRLSAFISRTIMPYSPNPREDQT